MKSSKYSELVKLCEKLRKEKIAITAKKAIMDKIDEKKRIQEKQFKEKQEMEKAKRMPKKIEKWHSSCPSAFSF